MICLKTLNSINDTLKSFEKQYGLNIIDAQQGSAAWLKVKLGVLSASNAHKIVAKKDSETRNTYMMELIAQICTGEQEEISSKFLTWGNEHEAAARSSYEFSTNYTITQVPFVFKDESFREGCSPDGLVDGVKGFEIKCPYNATNYIKFLTQDKIKGEYVWQYQFQMRTLECDQYDFVQYHPSMKVKPIKILTVDRDDSIQATLNDAVPQFISDMDKILDGIGVKFGMQWE